MVHMLAKRNYWIQPLSASSSARILSVSVAQLQSRSQKNIAGGILLEKSDNSRAGQFAVTPPRNLRYVQRNFARNCRRGL